MGDGSALARTVDHALRERQSHAALTGDGCGAPGHHARSVPTGIAHAVHGSWQGGDSAMQARGGDHATSSSAEKKGSAWSARFRTPAPFRWHSNSLAAKGASPGAIKRRQLAQRLASRLCGRLNVAQQAIVAIASMLMLLIILGSASAASSDVKDLLRSCKACSAINCVEFGGWWSCCMASLPGSCTLEVQNSTLVGLCDLEGVPLFTASCDLADPRCKWDSSSDPAHTSLMCQRLCFDC